jgi:hypothetical protein
MSEHPDSMEAINLRLALSLAIRNRDIDTATAALDRLESLHLHQPMPDLDAARRQGLMER